MTTPYHYKDFETPEGKAITDASDIPDFEEEETFLPSWFEQTTNEEGPAFA